MDSTGHHFLEITAINLPIGPRPKSPPLILSVMIGKNFLGAFSRVGD